MKSEELKSKFRPQVPEKWRQVLEQAKDRQWLAKVTNALNQYWQKKNAAKKTSHS